MVIARQVWSAVRSLWNRVAQACRRSLERERRNWAPIRLTAAESRAMHAGVMLMYNNIAWSRLVARARIAGDDSRWREEAAAEGAAKLQAEAERATAGAEAARITRDALWHLVALGIGRAAAAVLRRIFKQAYACCRALEARATRLHPLWPKMHSVD